MHFSNTTPLVFLNKKITIFKSWLSVSVLVVINKKISIMFTLLAVSKDAKIMWVCFLIHKILCNKQTVPIGTCMQSVQKYAAIPCMCAWTIHDAAIVSIARLRWLWASLWSLHEHLKSVHCRRCQYFLNGILKSIGTFRKGCMSCVIQITPGLINTKMPHRPR